MTTCKLSEIISPAFKESHHAVKNEEITELVEKGGRASTKSSYLSIEVILLLLSHPDINAAVFRRYANTLRTSVYSQIVWAIGELGLNEFFKCTISPMQCEYKPTGQKILFFGLDDPGKIKSIKLARGYFGVLWFEELDQYDGPEQIRNVEQSILRGGAYSMTFKSFNPPAMAKNWANQYAREKKPGKLVHHSTYLTTPVEWLGPRFLADAEHLKEVDPTAYRHEYLGEAVGSGGAVFDHIEERAITDEEIRTFDRIYQGADWGWFPDPFAFIRLHYDPAHETIYLLDELYVNKWANAKTGKWIIDHGYTDENITCDSAENKSIGDYREMGIPARGAIKGPGSIEYGMKWLQTKTIVIDPDRTPNAYREFTEYEYDRDKENNIVGGYVDADNHTIDATRYALERVWKRRGNSA